MIASVNDDRLVLLGRLRIDESGNGFLRFVVPDVPPGDYTTLTHCGPCAASSGGRKLLPTGPFPGVFVVAAGDEGSSLLPLALGAAGGTVLLIVAVWWTRRRRPAGISGP